MNPTDLRGGETDLAIFVRVLPKIHGRRLLGPDENGPRIDLSERQ